MDGGSPNAGAKFGSPAKPPGVQLPPHVVSYKQAIDKVND
jgi:hypothetical protein